MAFSKANYSWENSTNYGRSYQPSDTQRQLTPRNNFGLFSKTKTPRCHRHKLKRDVKPHITVVTSFHELVEITEKRDTIAHSTGLYGTRNQQSNAVSNAVIPAKPKEARLNNQGHHQRSSNNTSQYN